MWYQHPISVRIVQKYLNPVYRCEGEGDKMERKHLNMPESMARELENRSEELGISQGEIVRTALRQELEV